jgi:hypothetical protein
MKMAARSKSFVLNAANRYFHGSEESRYFLQGYTWRIISGFAFSRMKRENAAMLRFAQHDGKRLSPANR